MSLPEPPQPSPPEEKHPENFYTYRYDLIDRDTLAELLNMPPREDFRLPDSDTVAPYAVTL